MGRKSDLQEAAHKTVNSFSRIIGRRIYLRDLPKQAYSDYLVGVPFDGPDFYQRVELGIAHILFKTNAAARDAFVFHYAEAIEKQLQDQAKPPINKEDFKTGVRFLVGLLEEERVLSLWGELYKGSEELIRAYRASETRHLADRTCHHNVLHCVTIVATGHRVPKGDLSWVEPIMKEALQRVRLGTFQSTLLTAKWILIQLVDALMSLPSHGDSSFGARADALETLSNSFVSPASQSDKVDLVQPPKHSPLGAEEQAHQEAIQAINTNPSDLEASFQEQKGKMAEAFEEIQEKVSQIGAEEKSSYAELKARVITLRITAEDVLPAAYSGDDLEDSNAVARMQAFFQRVRGRRRRILDETGTEPDIEAAIQRRVLVRPDPVYRGSVPGRGFKAMLLLDRSGSMSESKLYQCYRAQKMIRKALDFPFVELLVWGFNGPESGTVLLTQFDADVSSMEVKKHLAPVRGATPLHAALHVARHSMQSGNEKKHIFILTDGAPMFWRWDGEPVATGVVRKQVREEVLSARRNGIGVTALIVRDAHGLPDGLNTRALERMFGYGMWQILDKDNFGFAVSDTVMKSFSRYLRYA